MEKLTPVSPFNEFYSFYFEHFDRPFLEHFQQEVSKPILPDDAPIEYTPTQIFTEYLKVYRDDKKNGIDGIVYKSSMNVGGKCIVLFRGPEISLDTDQPWLKFKGSTVHKVTGIRYDSEESEQPQKRAMNIKH